MDKKLLETTNLGEEIMNSKRQVLKEETWSRGTYSCLPNTNIIIIMLVSKGLPMLIHASVGRVASETFI